MSDFCQRIAAKFGNSWSSVGWSLSMLCIIIASLTYGKPFYPPLIGVALVLTLAWWIVDAVVQQVRPIPAVIGVGLIAISLSTRFGLLIVLIWILYWAKFRKSLSQPQ